MVETANTTGFVNGASDNKDGSSDDEPGPSPVTLLIEFGDWDALNGAQEAVLRAYDACAARLAPIDGREVSILLSSDAAIAELNTRYRGIPKATNVLSFPAAEVPGGEASAGEPPPLGDIIIAYETVMREAVEEQKPPLFHLAHLTIHGILHLAGFDHETDGDAERMEGLEREILGSIGIPDPYSLTLEETPALTG